jgi:glycosyltransferase involved in cell wall biosynthesis
MRIAIVSTPFVRVPPRGYGGTELFCAHLAEGLVRRGHRVTLFATGDSEFSGVLKACFVRPQWPPSDAVERVHLRWSFGDIANDADGYDVVHINGAHGIELASALGLTVVHTLHHPRTERFSRIYAAHPEVHYVGISRRQLKLEVPLRHATLIHHGVDGDGNPPSRRSDGRAHPHEGERRYYREELAPRFRLPGVQVVGEALREHKAGLLRGARALLCPIQWEEPFGLIAIEAMLAGTPVIGFARGSFPEIVDPGVTGLLVSDLSEMASAIHMARGWDRTRCARRAIERFSAQRMVADYERLFASIAQRWSDSAVARSEVPGRPAQLTG